MMPSIAGFDFRPYVIKSTSSPRYARTRTAGMNVRAVGNSHVSSPCREAARRNQLDGWKLFSRSCEVVSMHCSLHCLVLTYCLQGDSPTQA